MGYRLIQDETLPRGLKRIARDEIDFAIEQLGTKQPDKRDFAIHEARKSIKKLRGLMRMLAPVLGPSAVAEVGALGALGRTLSELRDAAALVEAVDLLSRYTREAQVLEQLADLRRVLQRQARETIERSDIEVVLAGGVIELRKTRRRLAAWRLEDSFEAIAPGLTKSYRRGRKALRAVHVAATPESFHNLRKRVKDRWYQVRILEGVWPHAAESPEKQLRDLQEDLGDDHNLAVLHLHVPREADLLGELLHSTQKKLREKSLAAAENLYAWKPDQYTEDLKALWEQWRMVPKSAKTSRHFAARAHSAA